MACIIKLFDKIEIKTKRGMVSGQFVFANHAKIKIAKSLTANDDGAVFYRDMAAVPFSEITEVRVNGAKVMLLVSPSNIKLQKEKTDFVPVRERKKQAEKKYGKPFTAFDRRWLSARYDVFKRDGKLCKCCGASGDGVAFHVDHILPKSKYPELAYEISNLQVLCSECNVGKGAKL